MALSRQLTVRFPADVAERIEANKHGSISEYVIDAVREKLQRDAEAEMIEGFALLVDADMQDMTFPTAAQKEAAKLAD